MKKIVLFLALVLGGFVQGQNEEIEMLLHQNERILNMFPRQWNVLEMTISMKDTVLKKELKFVFSQSSQSNEVEVFRGDENNAYNYFKYIRGQLVQMGSKTDLNVNRSGRWLYFSDNYFIEVDYLNGKNIKIDTVFDAEAPDRILFIDTIMYYNIEFPVKVYKKSNGKLFKTFTKEDLKNKAIKEDEILSLLKRSGVMFTVKYSN